MKKYLLLLALSGCATSTINKTVDAASWKRKGPLMVTQKGVNIGLEGVSYPNFAKHPELTMKLHWKVADTRQAKNIKTGKQQLTTIEARLPLIPPPAFIVRIKNDANGELDFSTAEITLEEKGGQVRKPYPNINEVAARVESDLIGTHGGLGANKAIVQELHNAITGLPLLDASTKIPAKKEFQGILIFKLDAHNLAETNDYFSKASGEWTVHMTNIKHPDGPLEIAVPLVRITMPLELECDSGSGECELSIPDAPPQQQEAGGGEGGGGGE